ncbi:Response regulators consisting of a CheY-like receiver domain and a winged-helix DNA-binding domain [Luteimonas sp. J16]|uniref:Hpt domain-containing response regulator n=1 Tax=unclassified Luteimonas TaxID=2629088 RepID=UPI0004AF8DDA|nr:MULTISPECIES: response regulator [unclassified Luteimonas]TWG94547.1 Response regulators consisting of a CheY-like receiver domain and a winged-helix DNA-binding domain [Luteimonas sp. J16]
MNPRILLVEDDPTSRAFLLAATRALPAEVDVACDLAGAIEAATACTHDLWLFDARLPDGSGAQLLSLLRGRGLATPALAHTASHERSEHEALRAAGFIDVLVKPMPAADWTAALRRALGRGGPAATAEDAGVYARLHGLPVWDDVRALAALGNSQANVSGLRQLFVSELPATRDAVAAAAERGDVGTVRDQLHRLRSGCGFVGAARLLEATLRLQAAPGSGTALRAFLDAAQDTLSAS